MTGWISKGIDRFALNRLHKNRSMVHHFKDDPTISFLPADHHTLNGFYSTPQIPHIDFEMQGTSGHYEFGKFFYQSEITTEDVKNNISAGEYYQTSDNEADLDIIFVHGWRMKNLDKIKSMFLQSFMKANHNMYFFTLPYHFDRAPEHSLYEGEFMVSANVQKTLTAVQHAISDLRALIYWLKNNSNRKTLLIGVSLGGWITNLCAVVEEKIDLLISIMYANNIPFSVWGTLPGKYIKQDFEHHQFTYAQLKKSWDVTIPSNFQPVIDKSKILLLSGKYDQYVLLEDSNRLWEAWNRPQRIVYPFGHAGIVLKRHKIANDVHSFIHHQLYE